MESSVATRDQGRPVSPAPAGGQTTALQPARPVYDVQPRLRGGSYSAKPVVPSEFVAAQNLVGVKKGGYVCL
eukprot:2759128-Lingulodinium_polyedra.AAC.1